MELSLSAWEVAFSDFREANYFSYFIISVMKELLFHYNPILCLKHKAEPLFHYCLIPEQMLSSSFQRIINCVFIYLNGTISHIWQTIAHVLHCHGISEM